MASTLPRRATYCPIIPPITPNDLRRTFASLLVQAGAPLDAVAKLLRHTSMTMLFKVYGQHTPESLAAQASVRVLYRPPKNAGENTDVLDGSTAPAPITSKRPSVRNVRVLRVGRAGHDPATYGLKGQATGHEQTHESQETPAIVGVKDADRNHSGHAPAPKNGVGAGAAEHLTRAIAAAAVAGQWDVVTALTEALKRAER